MCGMKGESPVQKRFLTIAMLLQQIGTPTQTPPTMFKSALQLLPLQQATRHVGLGLGFGRADADETRVIEMMERTVEGFILIV